MTGSTWGRTVRPGYSRGAYSRIASKGCVGTTAVEVCERGQRPVLEREELSRHFTHDLFPRTTNLYGCATLRHYHCYEELFEALEGED
jgi:hypothetical protein